VRESSGWPARSRAQSGARPSCGCWLVLEGYFLPIEHGLDDVAREINRELGYLSVLESRDAAGMTLAEAVAAGGAALDRDIRDGHRAAQRC
jgi:hypothetical protein